MSNKNSSYSPSIEISSGDRLFLDRIRGLSILRVVLVHLGLSWFYPPYSQFVHVFLPLLFFVSGAVSFFRFKRASGAPKYIVRRLFSIVMPYCLIVLGVFLYLWIIGLRFPEFNETELLEWLLINPESVNMPFPMGQVWFIHAMAIMIILSFPIFFVSKMCSWPLLIGIVFSLMLPILQQVYDIDSKFNFFGNNLYQALSNLGFFLFGEYYYSRKEIFSTLALLLLIFLLFWVFLNIYIFETNINMADHTYETDFYYPTSSYFAILFVILGKPLIDGFLNRINIMDRFAMFLSRNAYAIFMLHFFVLYYVETNFGLVKVADDPLLAILKIILIVSYSCIITIPVTRVSGYMVKGIENIIYSLSYKFKMKLGYDFSMYQKFFWMPDFV